MRGELKVNSVEINFGEKLCCGKKDRVGGWRGGFIRRRGETTNHIHRLRIALTL